MQKQISKTIFLIVGLFILVTTSYLNAWTGPTNNPPEGNTYAPINISNFDQTKSGILNVVGFKSWGSVVVASSTLDNYSMPLNLLLGVSGNVGARQYCDDLGQNCVTPPLASSANGGGGMPVGSIVYMASTNCPSGFIAANGASISRTTYSSLFSVIGTTFGSASASTFNVPDLRGYFIRGFGTNSDGSVSGGFGAKQGDTFESHTHTGTANSAGSHSHSYSYPNVGNQKDASAGSNDTNAQNNGMTSGTTGAAGAHTHSLSINASGGSETRPKNIALNACIKF